MTGAQLTKRTLPSLLPWPTVRRTRLRLEDIVCILTPSPSSRTVNLRSMAAAFCVGGSVPARRMVTSHRKDAMAHSEPSLREFATRLERIPRGGSKRRPPQSINTGKARCKLDRARVDGCQLLLRRRRKSDRLKEIAFLRIVLGRLSGWASATGNDMDGAIRPRPSSLAVSQVHALIPTIAMANQMEPMV